VKKKVREKKQEASSAVSHCAWKLVYAGVAKTTAECGA
jgi:hypothetical protein